MTQRIAVAVVHGVGSHKADFAKALAARVRKQFATDIRGLVAEPDKELQIRGVHWGPVLEEPERELTRRLAGSDLDWDEARAIMIDLGGDALAYQLNRQRSPDAPPGTYEAIHMTFAGTLRALAKDAGAEAPLCIVAHSLGTVIASNYLWDLQTDEAPLPVSRMMEGTPIELGRTLTALYTMGSPIAIWSLRFPDFGIPITFPPADLIDRYQTAPTEWVNLFDPDDVIGYPLKSLNDDYERNVSEDVPVNVGSVLTNWNPASHVGYWKDRGVVERVSRGLGSLWRAINS